MVTLGVLGGLAVVYYAVVGRLHFGEIAAGYREVADAYARHEAAEREAAQEPALLASERALVRWQEDLAGVPAPADAGETLLQFTEELKEDGLAVEHSEQLPPDGQMLRAHHRVKVAVRGTFVDLFLAVRDLENAALPTRVTDLLVLAAPDGETMRGELTIVRTWGLER